MEIPRGDEVAEQRQACLLPAPSLISWVFCSGLDNMRESEDNLAVSARLTTCLIK